MLIDILKRSRSVRSFKDKNVSRETLLSFVEACRYTPSTANLQALKFSVVTDKKDCEDIFAATKWAGYIKDEQIPPSGHEPAAYIVIYNDTSIAPNTELFFKDTGIAAQTIMLLAAESGLGGCMIGSFDGAAVKKVTGAGEELEVTLVLALGYPDEEPVIVDYEGDIKYYRENGIHYVPKRSVDEILV